MNGTWGRGLLLFRLSVLLVTISTDFFQFRLTFDIDELEFMYCATSQNLLFPR